MDEKLSANDLPQIEAILANLQEKTDRLRDALDALNGARDIQIVIFGEVNNLLNGISSGYFSITQELIPFNLLDETAILITDSLSIHIAAAARLNELKNKL